MQQGPNITFWSGLKLQLVKAYSFPPNSQMVQAWWYYIVMGSSWVLGAQQKNFLLVCRKERRLSTVLATAAPAITAQGAAGVCVTRHRHTTLFGILGPSQRSKHSSRKGSQIPIVMLYKSLSPSVVCQNSRHKSRAPSTYDDCFQIACFQKSYTLVVELNLWDFSRKRRKQVLS